MGALTMMRMLVGAILAASAAAGDSAWPRPGGTLACSASTPRPCPAHPGHVWCVNDPSPGQCDRPPVKECPQQTQPPPFCNTSLGFRERATDLVSRIPNATVKIGLLSTTSEGVPSLGIGSFEWCA